MSKQKVTKTKQATFLSEKNQQGKYFMEFSIYKFVITIYLYIHNLQLNTTKQSRKIRFIMKLSISLKLHCPQSSFQF